MGLCNSSYITLCRAILCYWPQNNHPIIDRFFRQFSYWIYLWMYFCKNNFQFWWEKVKNPATLIGLVIAQYLQKKRGIEKARKYGKVKIDSNWLKFVMWDYQLWVAFHFSIVPISVRTVWTKLLDSPFFFCF